MTIKTRVKQDLDQIQLVSIEGMIIILIDRMIGLGWIRDPSRYRRTRLSYILGNSSRDKEE